MDINRVYLPYACCFIVSGFCKILIVDVQRSQIVSLPIEIEKAIKNENNLSLNSYLNYESDEDNQKIISLFNFLLENEYIFSSDISSRFPSIEKRWERPSIITNAIITLDNNVSDYFEKIINELNDLLCNYIELIIYNDINIEKLKKIIKYFEFSIIKSIAIRINKTIFTTEELIDIYCSDQRICYLEMYSLNFEKYAVKGYNIIISNKTYLNNQCGKIDTKYFSPNLETYMESQFHNSCLNRKISIDVEGNIKNCPSMNESFGNISDTTLAEAIEKPGFKKYWDINKDKIHVCKDCEFRYICTDCRAYVEDPEDILSKPLKCGYNPYTGEWSEWSTNPLKQKAIDFYGMREMVNDMNKANTPE
jgi:SPASM domain peptide maturase of grasp-with-spasm system